MKRAAWIKEAIAVGGEYHFKKQKRLRHNTINLGSLGLVLLLTGLIYWAGAFVTPWVYVPLATLLLGCLTFSLYVLVIHECSHVMFLLLEDNARSEALNHLIGSWFGNVLFTDYKNHWEEGHVVHHLRPCEDVDPQNPPPVLDGRALLMRYLFLCIPLLGPLKTNPSNQYGFSPKRFIIGTVFWITLGTLCYQSIHPQVTLVILLHFQFVSILNFSKIAQEHAAGLETEEDPFLRSRTYHYLTALLTSPFNINYHWEHHANFKVPWYLLPAYHERVLEVMPRELYPYYLTRGWKEYFQQLAGTRALPPESLRWMLVEGVETAPAS